MRLLLAVLASMMVLSAAAHARGACTTEGYRKLWSGDRVPTAACQANLLGRVARDHGLEFRTPRSGGVRRQGRGSARPWAMTTVSQSPASLSSATSRPAAYSQGTVTVVPIAETNFLQPTS